MIQIAPLKTIASRLELARDARGVHPRTLVEEVRCDGQPLISLQGWYRWIGGENQGGCRDVALMAAFLGLTPNELLAESELAARETLAPDELAKAEELVRVFAEMNALAAHRNPPEKPLDLALRFMRETLAIMKSQNTIPAGTTIQSAAPGEKTYEPPRGAAGEAPPRYGKKRRKK